MNTFGWRICSFQAGPDISRKTTYKKLKALVLRAGKFSVFEATANERAAALYTRLCRDPEIEIDHQLAYPWTGVRRKERDP